MITESETQFYERLANQPRWRVRCATCRCPRWAHIRPNQHAKASFGCGCGKCPGFNSKRKGKKP